MSAPTESALQDLKGGGLTVTVAMNMIVGVGTSALMEGANLVNHAMLSLSFLLVESVTHIMEMNATRGTPALMAFAYQSVQVASPKVEIVRIIVEIVSLD